MSTIRAGMDGLVAAFVFWATSGLAGWHWPIPAYGSLTAGWLLVLLLGAWLRSRGWRGAAMVELGAGGLLLVGMNLLYGDGAVVAGRLVGGMFAAGGAVAAWRLWCERSPSVTSEPLTEPGRVLLIAAAAMGVMAPMFTDNFVGGTDARWYAYMLHDFIEQWRTAGPPVFIGQGEYVWNGAVHPFRSAPVYMHLAGLWDWLTLRSLSVTSLQHLTVITAALAAGWGLYASGVKLALGNRWGAAVVAMAFVLSPAVLTPLYMADAYMTYLASAVFVWLFHGNAKVLTEGRGWMHVAGALSMAWMCHPPTALQATVLTAFIQAGGLVFCRGTGRDWARAVGAGGVFVVLSVYYFTGMSELPRTPGGGMGRDLLQVGGLLAGWVAAAQMFLMRRGWRWGGLLLIAIVVLGLRCPPWAAWVVMTAGLLAAVRAAARRWSRFEPAGRGALVLLGSIVLGALIMDLILRMGLPLADGYPQRAPMWAETWSKLQVRPLASLWESQPDFEPGWGLWLAGAAAGLVAWRRHDAPVALFFGAIILMSPLLLHWPWIGDFLVEYIPTELMTVSAAPMHLRTMPLFTALLAVGALTMLRVERAGSGRWSRGLAASAALLVVAWYAWQARSFVQRGIVATASPTHSATNWRSENAPMDRFVYDLLPVPRYFNHGKMDPRLEVRLLANNGNLIYGPAHVVETMEEAGARSLDLLAFTIPEQPQWMRIEPGFAVAPGEHLLLRFEFDPARRYDGYLLFHSENGYRDYALPEAGFERAFGSGERQAKILSVWNSGTTIENYRLSVKRAEVNDLPDGTLFARLILSRFDHARALIEVVSLSPWRVRTRLPWSGQLETPRVFLPGYEVRVDGRKLGPDRISASPDRLLQIAMPPGEHEVEVNYTGTWKLRFAGVISLIAWLVWFGVLLWGRRARSGRPDGF